MYGEREISVFKNLRGYDIFSLQATLENKLVETKEE